ncbi:hypothetical protein SCANM63S_06772 [Streptomyces canarius]
MPDRAIRAMSPSSSRAVRPLRSVHMPQASDWAGSPAARRCCASPSRKALAAA